MDTMYKQGGGGEGWGGQRDIVSPFQQRGARSRLLRSKLPGHLEATASLYTAGYFECNPFFLPLQCCRVDHQREIRLRNMPTTCVTEVSHKCI